MNGSEEIVNDVISLLAELQEDNSVPKNIRLKLDNITKLLNGGGELPIRINKALTLLEEIADDTNMQQYTRTQMWSIVSMLEKINH